MLWQITGSTGPATRGSVSQVVPLAPSDARSRGARDLDQGAFLDMILQQRGVT